MGDSGVSTQLFSAILGAVGCEGCLHIDCMCLSKKWRAVSFWTGSGGICRLKIPQITYLSH